MVLQRLLDVTYVQAHGGDLRGHGRLHPLPASDDGVGGVHPCAHLVEVDVHGVHGRGEVLHVALAREDNPPNVVHLALVVAEQVLELADVVLQLVEVLGHGVQARGGSGGVQGLHGRGPAIHVGELLVEVALHVGELGLQLRLEVLEARGHLLQDLRVAAPRLPRREQGALVALAAASLHARQALLQVPQPLFHVHCAVRRPKDRGKIATRLRF
mmetsp:Transcript_66391/g.176824  ORF Transcript_66391/g.176824 Transcript_66391/m.176824 type:complete len:214 (+) Transcript_66391:1011-1652(+)